MVIEDGEDEGSDKEESNERADTDKLQRGWAPKEGGNSRSKATAEVEDAAEDVAADEEADAAADEVNKV